MAIHLCSPYPTPETLCLYCYIFLLSTPWDLDGNFSHFFGACAEGYLLCPGFIHVILFHTTGSSGMSSYLPWSEGKWGLRRLKGLTSSRRYHCTDCDTLDLGIHDNVTWLVSGDKCFGTWSLEQRTLGMPLSPQVMSSVASKWQHIAQ